MNFDTMKLLQAITLVGKRNKIGGLLIFFLFLTNFSFSQVLVTYSFTGGPQFWTVPPCVDTVTITMAGGRGAGTTANAGIVITYQQAVTTGQVFQLNVGGQGVGMTGGWNGGGNGNVSTTANPNSGGGGGATDIRVAPYALTNRIAVAGGTGGTNGSSSGNIAQGGAGGCPNGMAGQGSPFTIVGGGGGTLTAGGVGGPPWGGGGQFGNPGTLGQGGNGGIDLQWGTPGGGGGGGLFGGGGGGTDGCCIGSNGGGAGGGGSSLIPPGGSCTGTNVGNGYITISSGVIVANNTGPYCEGATIFLTATGGATSYLWTGPNGFTSTLQNPTIPNSTVANAGVYSVTATGVGCTASPTTTVNITPGIFPNAGIDDTVCFGSPFQLSGTITVATDPIIWSFIAPTIAPPAPIVTFAPAANNLTPMVTASKPGAYRFILQEGNPVCGLRRDTVNIFVKQMDIQTANTDPICFGSSDGTMTPTGTGVVDYSFDNGTTWSPNPGTGFPSGIYDVCVRDINQCIACTKDTLVDPLEIVVLPSNDTLICQNGTATLFASAINGTTYTYNWGQFPTNVDTQLGLPVANTYYSVQAVSSLGCLSPWDSIYVTVREPISGTISPDAIICPGYPTTLVATAQDGFGVPFTFNWSHGDFGNGSQHGSAVSPATTQNFSVTITDDCESSPLILTNLVTVAPEPVPSFTVDVAELCEPAVFRLYSTTDTATYTTASWFLSSNDFFGNVDTIVTNPLLKGAYSVQMVMVNGFGCVDSVTYPAYLTSHALPKAALKFAPGQPTMFSTTVSFDNFSLGAAQSQWTFESGNPPNSSVENPVVIFPEGQTGEYEVNLIVTSDFGCRDTLDSRVEVIPEVLLYAPNSFTPDGDEFNPTWRVYIEGIDVTDFNLEVRDRWGQVIWQSLDVHGEWDGTYRNELLPAGSYSWFIRAKDLVSDKPYTFRGNVMVVR